MNISQ